MYMSLIHSVLEVSESSNVEGGVGEGCMDPGHREDGQEGIDDGHHKQVPVVGGTFLQSG